MTKWLCALLLWAPSLCVLASDDPDSAIVLDITPYNQSNWSGDNILNASPSNIGGCGSFAQDDIWYSFTASGTSIVLDVDPGTFNPIAAVYNEDLSEHPQGCVDQHDDFTTEQIFLTDLEIGSIYFLSVFSDGNGQGNGSIQVRARTLTPVLPTPIADQQSNLIWTTNSNMYLPYIPNVQDWELELVGGGNTYNIITNSPSNVMPISICEQIAYNQTYELRVRPKINNNWCEWSNTTTLQMADYPESILVPLYCSGQIDPDDFISTVSVDLATEYHWKFVTDNGATELFFTSAGNVINLQDVEGMLYGQSYAISISVSAGNVTGPYGEACIVSTIPIPYSYIENCAEEMIWMEVDWVSIATEYIVRIYPYDPEDPLMMPIGQPQLTTLQQSTWLVLTVSELSLTPGQTYAVQVKVKTESQEGDYGPTCSLSIPNSDPLDEGGIISTVNQEGQLGESAALDEKLFSILIEDATVSLKTENLSNMLVKFEVLNNWGTILESWTTVTNSPFPCTLFESQSQDLIIRALDATTMEQLDWVRIRKVL